MDDQQRSEMVKHRIEYSEKHMGWDIYVPDVFGRLTKVETIGQSTTFSEHEIAQHGSDDAAKSAHENLLRGLGIAKSRTSD